MLFAQKMGIPSNRALSFFYHSITYRLIKDETSDMHCTV